MIIITLFKKVYDLDGTFLDEVQVTQLYKNVFDQFRSDHPDFSGAKIIFAPLRRADDATMTRYVELASQLRVSCNFESLKYINIKNTIKMYFFENWDICSS